MFGSSAASAYTVNSDSQITATAPAGAAGTVDITVTTAAGTSATSSADQFTYVSAPTVTAVSPNTGPTGGSTSVTITGTQFIGVSAVTFGSTAAASYTVNSATQITATAPVQVAGVVDITVTNPNSPSGTSSADQYTYYAGSLSVAGITSPSVSIPINTTSTNSSLGTQTDADTTGNGSGWNVTVALQLVQDTGAWSQTAGGAQALSSTAAGTYSGSNPTDYYDVTVTSGGTTSSTPVSWTLDSGGASTGTATNGSAFALSNGITITFTSGTAYTSGNIYDVRVGAMSTGAFVLSSGGSCSQTAGFTSAVPSVLTGTVMTSSSPSTFGTGVKAFSAASGAGEGTYTCTPTMNITAGYIWAVSYTGGVQYTIASGP
jgi:hypothetical protein